MEIEEALFTALFSDFGDGPDDNADSVSYGRPSSSTVPDTVDNDSLRDIPYEAESTMAPLSNHQPVFPGYVITLYSYFDFLNGESFSHLELDDFQILELKGCFHVPSKPYLDQFVQQYFLHVHPVLPILDERRFWELYLPGEKERGQTPGDGIPLLVFRAMMFASCGFVSAETIGALGYKNSLEARTSLYRQAKLLHDLETMSQPIAIAQSALLLSFYHSEREPVANTSWLRIAIQFAMFEKAHLFMQMRESLSREKYLCMKRLWWSVLHRDRVLSLGSRRPLQVSSDLFDPSQDPLCEADLEPEFTYSCVYSAGVKTALARVLISQVNLTVVLTDVIALIYPVRNDHHFDDPDRSTTRTLPDKLQDCRQGLSEWFVTSKQITRDTTHQAVMLFQNLSQIYYHSARAALCQFESLMLFGRKGVFHESAPLRLQEIGAELHSAVVSISDKVRELMELNMAQYLPVSILAHIALPLALETINQRTNSGTSKS
ncbi:hypothetical protein DL95DRAFT_468950 [Leptodontidium sp. 2 PMI_412]|nr:hypothetical protein DL95DRAFT_468950 [Leptodontidium sp. 2 PMI_412]